MKTIIFDLIKGLAIGACFVALGAGISMCSNPVHAVQLAQVEVQP
jgi:hypothetical protein